MNVVIGHEQGINKIQYESHDFEKRIMGGAKAISFKNAIHDKPDQCKFAF